MSSSLLHLARWACDLTLDRVPPSVIERVRLQHVGAAGILRGLQQAPWLAPLQKVANGRGAGPIIGGG